MTAVPRQIKPKPAPSRKQRQTIAVTMPEGDYEGWEFTFLRDFKGKLYAELESGSSGRVLAALDKIIVSHNFPDGDEPDKLAETIGDVDGPALEAIAGELSDVLRKLPNR